MEVAHFYHVWCCDSQTWPDILAEHLTALQEAGWDGHLDFTMVGPTLDRKLAQNFVADKSLGRDISMTYVDPPAWEQVTINRLANYAHEHPGGAILYAHTKGAADPTPFNHRWRQSMIRQLIPKWRWCAEMLQESYDAIGSHWLHPADYPRFRQYFDSDNEGFFGGNFWMARCDYLARLPRCSMLDRHKAERWIGLGKPRVYDLLEGWPADAVFDRGAQHASPAHTR